MRKVGSQPPQMFGGGLANIGFLAPLVPICQVTCQIAQLSLIGAVMTEFPKNVRLGVYFEAVPSPHDPPNAGEFYQALGMAIVAWGRLEGNFNHLFITVLNIASDPRIGSKFFVKRDRVVECWKLAFETIPALIPQRKRAMKIVSDMDELTTHRDHYVHGLWGHFVSTTPITRHVAKIKPRKEVPDGVWHSGGNISVDNLRSFLIEANLLNAELGCLADFLIPLRGEVPPDAHIL